MRQLQEYRLTDGKVVTGYTATEVVESMASMKLTTPRSRESYRRDTTRRAKIVYGVDLDPTTDATFLRSMLEAEILVKVL